MLWLDTKVKNLVTSINPKDIAFMLASSLEINRTKRTNDKAKVALDCLLSYKAFNNYMFEIYLKKEHTLRCAALTGVGKLYSLLYLGRSVKPGSKVYETFMTKKIKFDTHLESEFGRRAELLKRAEIKSSLFLPVDNFGVLVVNKKDKESISEYNLGLLKHFVDEVLTPSIELSMDNEKNMEGAIRDSLTGLYNHGYFQFQLEREAANAIRNGYNLSLIMIDVDYFKHYNDLHGHPMGDKILKEIANLLRYNTRRGDIVARYGGEEFAILLFNAKLKATVRKAEAIRKAVVSHHFDKEEMQPNGNLTISVGVANLPKHASEARELLTKADKALYHSKTTGRNKVTIYDGNMK